MASIPGEGSVFAFYIATMAGEEPTNAAREQKTSPIASEPSTNGGKDPNAERTFNILLVEDNIVNQKILAKQLRIRGNVVEVANNGVDALELLKKKHRWDDVPGSETQPKEPGKTSAAIDLILMDVEMPVMDGLTCTRKIRELEREGRFPKRLPVVAVTANVRQEQVDNALKAGVDRVLSKPFTTGEALDVIREIVG